MRFDIRNTDRLKSFGGNIKRKIKNLSYKFCHTEKFESTFREGTWQYSENIERKIKNLSYKFCHTEKFESTFREGTWQYSENIERRLK